MKITHIICTRNRAEQLSVTLAKFNTALMGAHQIEFVLVDSESTDDTPDAGQPSVEMPSPKRAQGAKA